MKSLESVCKLLENRNVFLTGGAGVGKSHMTSQIIEHYKSQDKNVVALGSTGVSAVAIGGVTVHSFFAFGISNSFEELEINDKKAKHRLNELKKIIAMTDLIIIDEISMVSTSLLDMIAYRLESMDYNGKILFVGDFFQLPPVVKYSPRVGLFEELLYAFESNAWGNFDPVLVELTQMHRTDDVYFTQILSKIRQGICDTEVLEYLKSLQTNDTNHKATYLFGRNNEVEHMNHQKLQELTSKEIMLVAEHKNIEKVHEKRLDTWQKALPVSNMLTLKVGAPVLFCVNKWGKFANGERGVIKEINSDVIIVEKDDGLVKVEPHLFELSEIHPNKDGKLQSVTLATMAQFPLRLAYAITIHKSQGMSIEHLVCNIDNIFAPSQFYVAISRATNPKYLKIDHNKGNFEAYANRIINVDNRVKEYYNSIL
jgi:ATP-dependent DNA helicase PIF1